MIDPTVVSNHRLSVVIFNQLLVSLDILVPLHEYSLVLITPANQDLLRNPRVQLPLVFLHFFRSRNLSDRLIRLVMAQLSLLSLFLVCYVESSRTSYVHL